MTPRGVRRILMYYSVHFNFKLYLFMSDKCISKQNPNYPTHDHQTVKCINQADSLFYFVQKKSWLDDTILST